MDVKAVLEKIKKEGIFQVDIRFMDFPGLWQHCTYPVSQFQDDDPFVNGLGFDGSSIRGWQAINESDMLLMPDPSTAFVDPFTKYPTLVMIADIAVPGTKAKYSRDPRHIAKKATTYLNSTGIGDTAFFGPELEFFVFDDIRYDYGPSGGFFAIDSDEAVWNTGRVEEGGNKGHKVRHKEGYFPVPPIDSQMDLRSEMVDYLQMVGIEIEAQHHEVATAGQAEIDMRFNEMVKMADWTLMYKYVLKNTACKNGKSVTFMPKPMYGDNGTGMHVHQSIWKGGKNLFSGDKYAGMSQEGLWYIGGILKHAPALVALTNPSTNSYKRLVPGFEAPIKLAYSARNRSAAVRIPVYSDNPKAKRIEFRTPDATANPYLAFSAMLMAGLDGIQNKIDPGEPLDKNIYDLPPEEQAKVRNLPGSLEEALNNLANDHQFLLKGDVFTKDVIETWIDFKIKEEVRAVDSRPHPYEFFLYYDM
ncbi:MAG: type I glutamate--ammonia ligase [Spirochaetes bacterium GWF1_51_8]|nr:MAG: type I glutamate--ammonia ligase [Spirochaetes bacterium GWF1_51_8]